MIKAKTFIQSLVIMFVSAFNLSAESGTTSSNTIKGNAEEYNFLSDPSTMANEVKAFRELKYGMFIHFSLSTFDGKEQTPGNTTSASIYKPTNLDVDQWIKVAKDAGMKYAVLTAKHSSGFCLWDSKVQWKGKEFDYDVGATSDTTDVVEAFMVACEKYGIVPGLYYCAMDTRHSNSKIKWTPTLPYVSAEYFQLMKDHLTELHTNYPAIAVQWIDIPRHLSSPERDTLYSLIRNLNEHCLIEYNFGKESGDINGDYSIAKAKSVSWPTDIFNSEVNTIKKPFQETQVYEGTTYELAYEHCISLDEGWFWDTSSKPKSLSTIISVWDKTISLNGNLLLNVPPDKTGNIPTAFINRLIEFKEYLHTDSLSSDSLSSSHDYTIHNPDFKLNQNYPNPFKQSTTIKYTLPKSGNVSLKICNLSGQVVKTLVNGHQTAGTYKVVWQPIRVTGATYLYRLELDGLSETKKLILNN